VVAISTPAWSRHPLPPLLPRYARPLQLGAILDESFQLFRRAWLPMMLSLVPWTVPAMLVALVMHADAPDDAATAAEQARYWAIGAVQTIASVLVQLPGCAAVVRLADEEMRGAAPAGASAVARAWQAHRAVVGRLPALALASLAAMVLVLAAAAAALPLFAAGLFGILSGPIALIALLTWWANPNARRPWVRRLIVLATPFGLPLYCAVLWSLLLPASVLEPGHARDAFRRSARLVRGWWWRVCALDFLLWLVFGGVLAGLPAFIVLGVLSFVRGWQYLAEGSSQADTLLVAAAGQLGWVLFGALLYVGNTVTFVDLRNRKEGADLAERLGTLSGVGSD
jgi:hypothetical protein